MKWTIATAATMYFGRQFYDAVDGEGVIIESIVFSVVCAVCLIIGSAREYFTSRYGK